MKTIDEKTLLLAVGSVGDDLIARAERVCPRRRRIARWGALAACLCVLALSASLVLESFRMGSAQPSGGSGAVESVEDASTGNAAAEPGAARPESNTQTDSAAPLAAAECLAQTGVAGAEDIVQVMLEGPAEDSKKEECALSGAALYDALAAAEVLPADSPRESALAYGQTLTLTLANGTVLTAPADAEAGAVRLGDWCYIGEEVKTALRSAL